MKAQQKHSLNLSAREGHKSKNVKAKATVEPLPNANKVHIVAKTVINVDDVDASTSHNVHSLQTPLPSVTPTNPLFINVSSDPSLIVTISATPAVDSSTTEIPFNGFNTSPTDSSQETPTFAVPSSIGQSSPLLQESPLDSTDATISPSSNSKDFVVPNTLSPQKDICTTSPLLLTDSHSVTKPSPHNLSQNKFAPLSGTFWGDDIDDTPIENWESIADASFNAVHNKPLNCIVPEQDRGSSILGSSSLSHDLSVEVSSDKSDDYNSPSSQANDPDYQPPPSSKNRKLQESDYLPVIQIVSNKQKRKLAQKREKETKELVAAGLSPNAIKDYFAIKDKQQSHNAALGSKGISHLSSNTSSQ